MDKSTLKKILCVVGLIVGIKCVISLGKFFFYENGSERLEELSGNVAAPIKTLTN